VFGLAPAIESSGSALVSTIRGAGTSAIRNRRLRSFLIAAQVAVSLALMIAGSMLVRSAIHTLGMATGYDGDRVVDLSIQFPEESKYTADYRAVLIRDLRTRVAALPGVSAITSARAPDDNGARTAAVSLNGEQPSSRNLYATLYYTWVQPNYFQTLGIPLSLGRGFQAQVGQRERAVILSDSDTFVVDESWLRREPSAAPSREGLSALADRELEMIEAALAESHGRISGPSGAAAKLGIPRQTLESKIRRLGIDKYGQKRPTPE